jgi:hypothetical protein
MRVQAATRQPISVFYSYAHEDDALRDELEKHLSLLQRQGIIHAWHDRNITGGSVWKDQIDQHLEAAQLTLLLISPDFLHSDYCHVVEDASRPRQRAADGHPLAVRREAPHNKRLQQTSPPANTFASGLAPDPQRVRWKRKVCVRCNKPHPLARTIHLDTSSYWNKFAQLHPKSARL